MATRYIANRVLRHSLGKTAIISSSSSALSFVRPQSSNQWFSTTSDSDNKLKKDDDNQDITVNFTTLPEEEKPLPNVDIDKSIYTDEFKLKMPDMDGDGKVLKWYKAEGDIIKRKDTLCDIELESFTFSMDSDDEGVTIMGEIYVDAESNAVKPGTPLATILHRSGEFNKKNDKKQ